ncbi:hypothetical protein BDR22DRAFT_714524 [Usnea florida]
MVAFTRIAILLSLAFTSVQAHPSHKSAPQTPNPAHLFKRALPQWKDFQPNDATNPQITQLTQAFKDMTTLVNAVLSAANTDAATYNTIFLKYFKDGMQAAVKQVFTNMVTPATKDPSTGADILANIVVDANDYAGGSSYMVAYTTNGEAATDPSSMHFSQTDQYNAYKYPALSAITCGAGGTDTGTIGTVVSDKMLSLGGYALVHELTHAQPVFSCPETKAFTDIPWTGDTAYGPQKTRMLAAGQGKDHDGHPLPAKYAISNADSYAWFANEVYWTVLCKRPFSDPTDNSFAPAGVCPPAAPDTSCEL